jgi:cytoskeleton protein RodZ
LTERDPEARADALTGAVLRQIGHHLRLAREERGETLEDIATFLRIRRVYLSDLENGDLANVPGRAYALGFLRSYGDHLGFDGDAIVEEVKRTDEPLPASPSLQVREPVPESHRPPLALVAVSLLLAMLVYVGWNHWQGREDGPRQLAATDRPASADAATSPAAGTVTESGASPSDANAAVTATAAASEVAALDQEPPPLPAIPEPPMPASVDALGAATAVTAAATGADAGAGESRGDAAVDAILEQPEADAPGRDDTTRRASAPAAAAARPDASPNGAGTGDLLAVVAAESGGGEVRTFGEEEAGGRIVLVASAASWVQVKSGSSDFVWTRTLEAGDAYFVPDRENLALWTGNAGGLKVVLDGEPLASLGDPGQVRRDIPLAADALRAQYAGN